MSDTFRAQLYLSAFKRSLPIQGGLAHEAALRASDLDYTWDSLARIDAFLDTLREREHPQPATFFADQANTNLLYLLAFYVGELRARIAGVPAQWMNWHDLLVAHPDMHIFGEGFHSSMVQTAPGLFLPLVSISSRLFDGSNDKSVQFSAGTALQPSDDLDRCVPRHVPVPPLPQQSLIEDFPARFAALPLSVRAQYTPAQWPRFDNPELNAIIDALPTLPRQGRVVWAALVQANKALFEPGQVSTPGELLYDPRGFTPAEDLRAMAQFLFQTKGTQPDDPELRRYAEHITDEFTVIRGWRMPASVLPYVLEASTTVFHRQLLPGGVLANTLLPVMVSDDCPGIALLAPWQLWPEDVYAAWKAGQPDRVYPETPTSPPLTFADGDAIRAQLDYEAGIEAWRLGQHEAAITQLEKARAAGDFPAVQALADIAFQQWDDAASLARGIALRAEAEALADHHGVVPTVQAWLQRAPIDEERLLEQAEALLVNAVALNIDGAADALHVVHERQRLQFQARYLATTPTQAPVRPPPKKSGWLRGLFGG